MSDSNSEASKRAGAPDPQEPASKTDGPDEVPPADILAPSPLLTLAAFLIGLALEAAVPTQILPSPWRYMVGVPLVAGGTGLFGWTLVVMRRHDKHPSHDDEPPELITDGPFRISRNPIYVGHSLAHAGAAVLIGSLWALLALAPVVGYLRGVIRSEEARLSALFGKEYDRYRQRTRRWL